MIVSVDVIGGQHVDYYLREQDRAEPLPNERVRFGPGLRGFDIRCGRRMVPVSMPASARRRRLGSAVPQLIALAVGENRRELLDLDNG